MNKRTYQREWVCNKLIRFHKIVQLMLHIREAVFTTIIICNNTSFKCIIKSFIWYAILNFNFCIRYLSLIFDVRSNVNETIQNGFFDALTFCRPIFRLVKVNAIKSIPRRTSWNHEGVNCNSKAKWRNYNFLLVQFVLRIDKSEIINRC